MERIKQAFGGIQRFMDNGTTGTTNSNSEDSSIDSIIEDDRCSEAERVKEENSRKSCQNGSDANCSEMTVSGRVSSLAPYTYPQEGIFDILTKESSVGFALFKKKENEQEKANKSANLISQDGRIITIRSESSLLSLHTVILFRDGSGHFETVEESSLSLTLQMAFPFILAGLGMVLSGRILDIFTVCNKHDINYLEIFDYFPNSHILYEY